MAASLLGDLIVVRAHMFALLSKALEHTAKHPLTRIFAWRCDFLLLVAHEKRLTRNHLDGIHLDATSDIAGRLGARALACGSYTHGQYPWMPPVVSMGHPT